jgi:branched-chain amino acid aminotransferase
MGRPTTSALPLEVCLEGGKVYLDSFRTGTGAYKLGVNYAPCVLPQKSAAALGYSQNLWLHGEEHHLTEVCARK